VGRPPAPPVQPSETAILTPRATSIPVIPAVDVLQNADAFGIEWKDSRNQAEDLQRVTMIYVYIVQGRPEQAARSQLLGGITIGSPHNSEPDFYVVHVRFEHYIPGPDPNTATSTPTSARDSAAYTKMTVTYQQRPCPGKWEEDYGVSLIGRLEWFDRSAHPRSLKDTRDGATILIPVPIYKRHYPKVFLTATERVKIRQEIGKVSGATWEGHPAGFWLLTGLQGRLLYGDPKVGRSAWEITVHWRGDPDRHHEWWWVRLHSSGPNKFKPRRPADNSRTAREAVMMTRTIYDTSAENWDTFIPLRGTPCEIQEQQ